MLRRCVLFITVVLFICGLYYGFVYSIENTAEANTSQTKLSKDLQEWKNLVFIKGYRGLSKSEQRKEEDRLFEEIHKATTEDEEVFLSFIKKSLMDMKTKSEDEQEKKEYVLKTLNRKLGEIGSEKTVKFYVQWLSKNDWKTEDKLPLRFTGTLMEISSRVEIDKELLKPLSKSKNKDIAALAERMQELINYQNVPSDLERVVACGVSREFLERDTGLSQDSWKRIAQERGFTFTGGNVAESLLLFMKDCDQRSEKLMEQYKKGQVDNHVSGKLRVREHLLCLYAIEELIKNDRNKAFEYLVNWMDKGDGTDAAYYLYIMTGKHFPIYGYQDYGKSRTNVDLTKKAAEAWRQWRKTNELTELTKSQRDEIELNKRLAEFYLKGIRSKGHLGTVEEAVDELLTTKDERVQKMLVGVLAEKELTDKQIQKIIDSAKSNLSESDRLRLWQVLFNSGNLIARKHLVTVVNKNTEGGIVLKFLEPVENSEKADVDFLSGLYLAHPSESVKDRIVQIAGAKYYGSNEQRQIELVKSIIHKCENQDHKLKLLWAVYNRAGVNREGRAIAKEVLKNEKSPELRKAIYEKLIKKRPEMWLEALLENKEPEETILAGFEVFGKAMSEGDSRRSSLNSRLFDKLVRIAEKDPSEKIRLAAGKLIDDERKFEIEELINDQKQMLGRIKKIAVDDKQKGTLDEKTKEKYKAWGDSGMFEFYLAGRIHKFKRKYGILPEEKEIKSKLTKIRKEQIKVIREVLDSEK